MARIVSSFTETHLAQMIGYLRITGLEVALLLTFKENRLGWKRVVATRRERPTESAAPAPIAA